MMVYSNAVILVTTVIALGSIAGVLLYVLYELSNTEYNEDVDKKDQMIDFLNDTKGGDWYYDVVSNRYADFLTDRTHKDE